MRRFVLNSLHGENGAILSSTLPHRFFLAPAVDGDAIVFAARSDEDLKRLTDALLTALTGARIHLVDQQSASSAFSPISSV